MISFKRLWPLVLILLLALCFYRALDLNPHEMPSAKLGHKIPDLVLMDYERQKPFKIHDLQGKAKVIHFWASWCDSCVEELLLLQTWQKQHQLDIVGINYKERHTDLANFFRLQENIFKPLLLDEEAKLGIEMGVVAVPETFVIDKQGIIIYRHQGPLNEQELAVILGKVND